MAVIVIVAVSLKLGVGTFISTAAEVSLEQIIQGYRGREGLLDSTANKVLAALVDCKDVDWFFRSSAQ
jgi:hypothetical protein